MANIRKVKYKKVLFGNLPYNSDLLKEITSFCKKNNIRLGKIEAIGALQKANIGFFDQSKKKYCSNEFDKAFEIINLTGNISIKDGEPFIHAHITLADENGKAFGGHLLEGNIVFACELIIYVFDGGDFVRKLDKDTGVFLWE